MSRFDEKVAFVTGATSSFTVGHAMVIDGGQTA